MQIPLHNYQPLYKAWQENKSTALVQYACNGYDEDFVNALLNCPIDELSALRAAAEILPELREAYLGLNPKKNQAANIGPAVRLASENYRAFWDLTKNLTNPACLLARQHISQKKEFCEALSNLRDTETQWSNYDFGVYCGASVIQFLEQNNRTDEAKPFKDFFQEHYTPNSTEAFQGLLRHNYTAF